MVETRTCDYSGQEIEPGTGIMYVQTDGTVLHFADSKAEKNYFLGREARDLEWTEAGREDKERARATEREEARAESTEADAPEPGTERAATEEEATVEPDEETAEEVTADEEADEGESEAEGEDTEE